MTKSTITRERLEQLADNNTICKVSWDERIELAQIALAAMNGEPVILYRQVNPANGMKTYWAELDPEEFRHLKQHTDENAEFMTLYRHAQQPVVDADDNFYSWFGREWAENYQHNQYTTAAKQMLGVMAESAWKAGRRAAMLQAESVCSCPSGAGSLRWPCPVHPGNSPAIGIDLASGQDRTVEVRYVAPPGYVMVPKEPTDEMIAAAMNCEDVLFNSDDSFCVQFGNIYEAMLAAAPQEVKGE